MLVVAYAPTEKVPEGQKAKYMAALNSTVAAKFARNYVMVLTDTNTRTGRRGGGRRGTRQQSVGLIWPRTASGFGRRQRPCYSEHGFLLPKRGVSYTFENANHSKGKHVWTTP